MQISSQNINSTVLCMMYDTTTINPYINKRNGSLYIEL